MKLLPLLSSLTIVFLPTTQSTALDIKECVLPSCAPLLGKYDVYGCTDPDPLQGLGPDSARVSYISPYDEMIARAWEVPAWCMEYMMGPSTHPDSPWSEGLPIANGTREYCFEYAWVARIEEEEYSEVDCWVRASFSGVTKEEFIDWNPSLAENKTAVGPPVTKTRGGFTRTVHSDEFTYPCTMAHPLYSKITLTRTTYQNMTCDLWWPLRAGVR